MPFDFCSQHNAVLQAAVSVIKAVKDHSPLPARHHTHITVLSFFSSAGYELYVFTLEKRNQHI